MTDRMVLALAAERATYLRTGRADRVIPVDEQLERRGYCVDSDGNLIKLEDHRKERQAKRETAKQADAPERADAKAPEDTAEAKPQRRSKAEK